MEFLEALFECVGTLLDTNADGVVDLADAASGAGSAVEAVSSFADADGSGIINFEDAKSLLFDYTLLNNKNHRLITSLSNHKSASCSTPKLLNLLALPNSIASSH